MSYQKWDFTGFKLSNKIPVLKLPVTNGPPPDLEILYTQPHHSARRIFIIKLFFDPATADDTTEDWNQRTI